MLKDSIVIKLAAENFDIGQLLKITYLDKGLGNRNYLVKTTTGSEYILRILVWQTLPGLKNELAIQKQLKKKCILTSHLLTAIDGKYYSTVKEKVITCTKKIVGKRLKNITLKQANQLGFLLSGFHVSVKYLPITHKGWLSKEIALKEIKRLPVNQKTSLLKNFITENIDIFDHNLPCGIIHSDLHLANVLYTKSKEFAIFDFEESENNLFIIDIARAVTEMCVKNDKLDENLATAFLDGYQKQRKIEKEEFENLNKAMIYVSGAGSAWLYNEGYMNYVEENIKVALSLIQKPYKV